MLHRTVGEVCVHHLPPETRYCRMQMPSKDILSRKFLCFLTQHGEGEDYVVMGADPVLCASDSCAIFARVFLWSFLTLFSVAKSKYRDTPYIFSSKEQASQRGLWEEDSRLDHVLRTEEVSEISCQ
mmetsp:Transcript_15843/g.45479  ORF Transcript_15843/g.45479 Transcript_15843/m.45479 type:complete len:126 (+) Transcript_15843:1637-2014(+)